MDYYCIYNNKENQRNNSFVSRGQRILRTKFLNSTLKNQEQKISRINNRKKLIIRLKEVLQNDFKQSLSFINRNRYSEFVERNDVIVSIPEGEVLEGSIPSSKMKLLRAWVEIHRDELVADWELAVSGEQPYKIEPLR